MELEDDRMLLRQPRERLEEPGGERVGVDRERHRGPRRLVAVSAERRDRVVLEQRALARQPHDRGPAAVGRAGFDRTSRTLPSCSSSVLMRWLTADGVMCRRRAAASSVPSSTTTAIVSASSKGMRIISHANAPEES